VLNTEGIPAFLLLPVSFFSQRGLPQEEGWWLPSFPMWQVQQRHVVGA